MAEQLELLGAEDLRLVADAYGPIDGPPALLLHGLGQTRQSWGLAAAKLGGQGWRACAVDQRGHGDSDRSATGAYEHADVAADVLALCAALKQPPLIIGASMGGVAALVAQGTVDRQLFRVSSSWISHRMSTWRVLAGLLASCRLLRMAMPTLTKPPKRSLPTVVLSEARPRPEDLAGCSAKAATGVGGGIGIHAYSTRERAG